MPDNPELCHVCGNPLDPSASSTCNNCERLFHLRQREDADGIDCGQVWINELYLALEYACDICLGNSGEPGTAEPPVGFVH